MKSETSKNALDSLDFKRSLAGKAECVNSELMGLLGKYGSGNERLGSAIKYTLESPGKRVRSAMVLWCCEVVAGEINDVAKAAAAAIEMVHTYSLVHDDLPAMDDDDMRRGVATCHKAFDEATAILTGDALLTLAFEVIASQVEDSRLCRELVLVLAKAGGCLVAGQMADLEGEKVQGSIERLEYIHENKTAMMFGAASAMGAISGGGTVGQIESLREYGLRIGLGFQIADDILDVSGVSDHLGKTAGKDVEQGKMTYPAVVGMEQSRQMAEQIAGEAVEALSEFGGGADILRHLANELLNRTR